MTGNIRIESVLENILQPTGDVEAAVKQLPYFRVPRKKFFVWQSVQKARL